MEKDLVKKAFDEASKDIEKEKREKIKKIILETLKKREELKEDVAISQKKIKLLTKDLEDFKQGRLDLIEERQKVDKLAKKTSVVRIEKIIHEHHYEKPWYEPFRIYPCMTYEYTDTTFGGVDSSTCALDLVSDNSMSIAGTDFHNNFSGSYNISGLIINL